MLAYVFWHWRDPAVSPDEYESRVELFHRALMQHPAEGFARSYSVALRGALWANAGGEAYEDWYLLSGSAALDRLNDAAVSGARQTPHDAAARAARGGTAALYRVRLGQPIEPPRVAYWFAKPAELSYQQLDDAFRQIIRDASGTLWVRQMVLGPAPECCLHAREACDLPPGFSSTTVSLRPVWPIGAPAGAAR